MADKMLRTAGRDESGRAKPLSMQGEYLKTTNTEKRILQDGQYPFNPGDVWESDFLDRGDFSSSTLYLSVSLKRALRIHVEFYEFEPVDQRYVLIDEELLLEAGHSTDPIGALALQFSLRSEFYKIKIEQIDNAGSSIWNINEIRSKETINREVTRKRMLESGQYAFNAGDVWESDLLVKGDFSSSTLYLSVTLKRSLRIHVEFYELEPVDHHYYLVDEELLLESHRITNPKGALALNFALRSEFYKIKIEQIDEAGSSIWNVHEIRSKEAKDTFNLESVTNSLNDLVKSFKKQELVTKQPLTTLKLNKLFENRIKALTKGFDGRYYVINLDNTINVYEDLISGEVVETGMTFDFNTTHFKVLREGVLVTKNNDDGSCEVLYSESINGELTSVYKSPIPTDPNIDGHFFARAFGLSTYDNGVDTFVLLGVYGRGDSKKDLLFSKNGGKTMTVVKQTENFQEGVNSHWHDVEIDQFHGFLWAAHGDGNEQHGVYYSADFGETWDKVVADQPTAIVAFPNRVFFGRDDNQAGIDSVIKPKLNSDKMSYEPVYELKYPGLPAHHYYLQSPLKEGAEAYMTADISVSMEEPSMVIATGDFGESWHSVHIGSIPGEAILTNTLAMDENYIYFAGRNYGGEFILFYSKRVEWV